MQVPIDMAMATALIAALVEAVKRALNLGETQWTRVLPLVALLLGIGAIALISSAQGETLKWQEVVLYGLLSGLSAMGLYKSVQVTRGIS